jgi:hypothetical protein
MSATTAEEFVQLVRQYYPQVLAREDPLAARNASFEHSPEHQRWKEAWSKARNDQPWNALLKDLKTRLPEHSIGSYVPQYLAGGYSCFISVQQPLSEGGYRLVRVGGAISVLTPLYLLFGTTELLTTERVEEWERSSRTGGWTFFSRIQPQLCLPPTPEMQPYADDFARSIEGTLGYQPFPAALAPIAVPGVHVPHLHHREATLMNTLFMSDAALFLADP